MVRVPGPMRQALNIRFYEGGKGTPVLYLHGAGGLLPNDPFLAQLAQTYQVYAPLLPGYEDSEGSDILRTMLDFTLHVSDVARALELSQPIVIGHSMGGMLAAEWAALAPAEIGRLLLLAPTGLWLDEFPVTDLFTTLPYELPGLLFAEPERYGSLLSPGGDLNDPEYLTEFLVVNARRMGTAGKMLFPIPDRGLKERLYRIRAQTQILWGRDDRVVSCHYADAFVEQIANARASVLEHAGHLLQYEQPARVVEAVDKLADSHG